MVLLNTAASRFVGREEQLVQLQGLLAEARLVTLCGSPGIGKTRTALEYVARHAPAAQVCDLAALSEGDPLARALVVQLGGATEGELHERLAVDALVAACEQHMSAQDELLVVLDNAEHLVASLGLLVGDWLAACPGLRLLVTSRERLRVPGERMVELPPLSVSGEDDAPSEASLLFIDRWRDSAPDIEPDAAEHEQITQIVTRLDGIPLAIELAAARVPVLGLTRLTERLHQQLSLLSRGARGAPARQATLRGAIDWSWQLLTPEQQRALALCAVFCGPFEVDAAEAVLGEDALDRLQDLRDRSLLLSPRPGCFDVYASIGAYAAEAMARRTDAQHAILAHAHHYIALGEEQARQFERRGTALSPLLALHGNLLRATEQAIAMGQPELAARGCVALGPVLRTRGPLQRHVKLLDQVLAVLDDEPELLRARGLARRGLGQLAEAEADLLAALDGCDGGWLYAAARKDLGVLYHQQRDIDRARVCYEAALGEARSLADRRMEGMVIGNLGALDHDTGRYEQAAQSYEQALSQLRAAGDRRLEAIFVTNLGVLEQEQGRRDRAAECYRSALRLLEQVPDLRFEGIALGNLGVMEHEAGHVGGARELHDRALARLRQVGERSSHALCLARLGAALAELGQLNAADERLREAEQLVSGAPLMLRVVRLHRCFLDLAEGHSERAMARVAEAQRGDEQTPKLVEVSDDARVVLRMLGTRLAGDAPRLEVAADASWFCVPGGNRQSLAKYASARRILAHLAQARLDHPGEPVAPEALFEAGWPGVQIAHRSAMNRLFVALAKLRKLGLKLLLLRSDDGYLLDPATPLLRPAAG